MDGRAAPGATGSTVGVLSVWFGGSYFGRLLAGLAPVAAEYRARLVGLQTLDAGAVSVDLKEPPHFAHPVAWEHLDGLLVMLNAVDADYLHGARRAGKPVIAISDTVAGFSCPTVLPDNGSGVREAVEHLIGHGHREIGFVGNPVQRDLRERFDAYQATMRAADLDPHPDLFFDTGDNQVAGGERAARSMLEARRRPTAVVTGNDLNALGLIRTLRAHGHRVPRDLAVVGFDDMDDAVFHRPSLSTVRQPFETVGAAAGRLLMRALEGEEIPSGFHYVPTSFVARESCGCPSTLRLPDRPEDLTPIRSREDLATSVAEALSEGGAGVADVEFARPRIEVVAAGLDTAARDEPEPEPEQVLTALTDLYQRQPDPESLAAVLRAFTRYGAHVLTALVTTPQARDRVEARLRDLILSLSNVQAASQFEEIAAARSTFFTDHQVSIDLLRSHEDDPRSLGWLARQPLAKGGCLGLWPARPGPPGGPHALELFGSFPAQVPPGTQVPVSAFPPADLIGVLDRHPEHMVFVIPMKLLASDRGMLAVAAPIEPRLPTGRENVNQWAAMLTVTLDQMALLESLQEQQELLRHSALYDQLTDLPNRRLFLDRLERTIHQAGSDDRFRFAVLLLDLDGFKLTNDSLGHLAGDDLLVQVAERIRANLRDVDIAARIGGDEFLVLLDGIERAEDTVAVAARLQQALAAPFRLGEQEVNVGASIGIALSTDAYRTADDLIRNADLAMYEAKSRGKATHAVFDVAMRTRAVERLQAGATPHAPVPAGRVISPSR